MAEIESCHLVLESRLGTPIDGTSTIVYKNINLIELLGDLYDKYDRYKIVLYGFQNANPNSIPNRNHAIKLSGLDWVGELEYLTDNTSLATIGMVFVSSNSNFTTVQSSSNWGCVFNKPNRNNIDITIHMIDLITNTTIPSNNYGPMIFYFSIYGIK
jgi:hypothetical protein